MSLKLALNSNVVISAAFECEWPLLLITLTVNNYRFINAVNYHEQKN